MKTKKNRVVAFIPVRGGSKSIPLKNIKKMYGRPLVYWAIDAAVECEYIDEVYVSTDSIEIEKSINCYDKEHHNKLKCIKRSPKNATDTATTESVLMEFIDKVKSTEVVLIQATSPLIQAKDLDAAFRKFYSNNYDSLLSLVRQKRFIWTENDNETVQPVNYNVAFRSRRQDFEGFLVENGAFYISKYDAVIKSELRISGKIGHYEMQEESYIEIDEPGDWIIVEEILKKREREKQASKKSMITPEKVKLFATDCDGVLTDAGMYYSENGDMLKKFNTKDGMGLSMLKENNIILAILTGENSAIVKKRAEKLGIEEVILGCKDKVAAMDKLISKYNINYENVAFIGDDVNDLELLKKVGYSFSVADAIQIVKDSVDYVTFRKGGEGAVREVADLILSKIGREYNESN
ncbi:acylneuraminate cytidylyltransferase [Sporosarcina highlanderae]|uniref:N-acylneuraminate cytidylyltransferase n=1 Tax=Sporosarcina highlanderae TaxID=3035916 RepID=A0ABT8JP07_9BACL|nr:acylneuraminate cytidylyltransferase [Sporosarcina highlanderae]MDN4606799.1 HAD-IIIA family hydrolase [Sporosarcina highlanderae]